jgi:mercuric ion transport protein
VSSSTRERNEVRAVHEPPAALPAAEGRDSKGWLASLGAVFAAFGASLCCVGPLLFVTFGVGAGLASTFEPLRPLFTALTVLGLGIGFYTVYGRKPKAQAADACCAPGDACAVPRSRAREKVILWTATVLAVVLWSFNYWSTLLV